MFNPAPATTAYNLTTDFVNYKEFASLEEATEAACKIWIEKEALCTWIMDGENNIVRKIKTSVDYFQ